MVATEPTAPRFTRSYFGHRCTVVQPPLGAMDSADCFADSELLLALADGVLLGQVGGNAATLRHGQALAPPPLPDPRRLPGPAATATTATARPTGATATAPGGADVSGEAIPHLDRVPLAQ